MIGYQIIMGNNYSVWPAPWPSLRMHIIDYVSEKPVLSYLSKNYMAPALRTCGEIALGLPWRIADSARFAATSGA